MSVSMSWALRLLRVASCGLLLAVVLPTIASADVTFNQSFPVTGTLTDVCTGDMPAMQGTMHVLMHETSDSTGLHIDVTLDTHEMSLTEPISGDHFVSSDYELIQDNFTQGATETTNLFRSSFVKSGESGGLPTPTGFVGMGDDEFMYTQLHLTVNAVGAPTATIDTMRASCQ
jgi:hypothetical protein